MAIITPMLQIRIEKTHALDYMTIICCLVSQSHKGSLKKLANQKRAYISNGQQNGHTNQPFQWVACLVV